MIKDQISAAVTRATQCMLEEPESLGYPIPTWIAKCLVEEFMIYPASAEALIAVIAGGMVRAKSAAKMPMYVAEDILKEFNVKRRVQ